MSILLRAFEIIALDPGTPPDITAICTTDRIALRVANGFNTAATATLEPALSEPGQLKASHLSGSRILLLNRISILAFISLLTPSTTPLDQEHWVTNTLSELGAVPALPWITVNNHVHLLDVLHDPFANGTTPSAPMRIKLSFLRHQNLWVVHQVLNTTLRPLRNPPWSLAAHPDKLHLQHQIEHLLRLQALLRLPTIPNLPEHHNLTLVLLHGNVRALP